MSLTFPRRICVKVCSSKCQSNTATRRIRGILYTLQISITFWQLLYIFIRSVYPVSMFLMFISNHFCCGDKYIFLFISVWIIVDRASIWLALLYWLFIISVEMIPSCYKMQYLANHFPTGIFTGTGATSNAALNKVGRNCVINWWHDHKKTDHNITTVKRLIQDAQKAIKLSITKM